MDDLISRLAALDALSNHYEVGNQTQNEAVRDCENIIMQLPTIEPKKGKWEVVDEEEPRWYGCSLCKKMARWPFNYCPNCGARMERSE